MLHTPVLLTEVLQYLDPQPGKHYIDATADGGGHAIAIINAIQPSGKLLAIEWDETLFEELTLRLQKECTPFSKNYVLRRASYTELASIARSFTFSPVAGVLFDLGLSSRQLEGSSRGFSFQKQEALDMRYSTDTRETAADMLKRRSAPELENILREYGEERFSRPIAKHIVETRAHRQILTSADLVRVISEAVPARFRRGRIHFATRTFQALRIAVNHELENIPKGLAAAADVLVPGGRIVVISFHSLEDRIVKNFFRREDIRESFTPVVKKPVRPSLGEIAANPRARSARLRVFERII